MRRLRSIVLSLAVVGAIALPSVAQDAPAAAKAPERDAVLEKLVARRLAEGNAWFGLKISGKQSGYLHTHAERREVDGHPYLRETMVVEMTITSMGAVTQMRIDEVTDTSLVPPYPLLQRMKTQTTTNRQSLHVVRNDDGTYRATIRQGDKERRRDVGRLDLGLDDLLAVPRWLQTKRDVGATHRYRELDDDRLEVRTGTATVKSRKDASAETGAETVYDLVLVDEESGESQVSITPSGRVLRMSVGEMYVLERMTESEARRLESSGDFFVEHSVPRKGKAVGDPARVKAMTVRTGSAFATAIGQAPGQTVVERADGTSDLVMRPGGTPRVKATAKERERALEATVDVPARETSVVALARRAIGDARTPEQKVRKLVAFVSAYIEDDLSAEPASVLDIIRVRRGDCSEHADLFTALARAVDVPCRTVGGVMYAGPEMDSFGGHAWNEVILDGHWTPVDPTWAQFPIDATHIRFPILDSAHIRATTLSRAATLAVVDVKR